MVLLVLTVRENLPSFVRFTEIWTRQRVPLRSDRANAFRCWARTTLSGTLIPLWILWWWGILCCGTSWSNAKNCMRKKILQMKTDWKYPSWKRNLPSWTDGMRKATQPCCWADWAWKKISITYWWVNWVVRKKCVSCWRRHCTEIRTTSCSMSLPMTWIWKQWPGWKNILPTSSIPYWW